MKTSRIHARYRDAISVKTAEILLKSGQPSEAMTELERVSENSRQSRWFEEIFQACRRMQRACIPRPA